MQESIFKKATLFMAVLTACAIIAGCTTNAYTGEEQVSRTAIGAGSGALVGAGAGAAIGGLVGGSHGAATGALIGGVSGLVAGGAVGGYLDYQNAELQKQLAGTGVQVKKVGNTIQLIMPADITFDFNSSQIKSSFYPVLDSVAIVLKKYNRTNIDVAGYTDNVGSDTYNQSLSEKRAKSVGNYLAYREISTGRIFTEGFGKRYPVATNSTAEGRALNRRVVLTLRET
jgi:outer membrane protein OmpA-like peptidoglycan-associated protein